MREEMREDERRGEEMREESEEVRGRRVRRVRR